MENKKRIYCNMGRYLDFDNQLIGWLKTSESIAHSSLETTGKLVDIGHILHEMRLIKTKDEIPYIYERNGEEVYRRREGDSERELLTDAEFHASKKPIKKDIKYYSS